jgi:hypothetical protein
MKKKKTKTNKVNKKDDMKKQREIIKQIVGATDEDFDGETIEKQIGVVGVDSGQVVICDPCYIDSEWVNEELVPTPAIIEFPDGTKEEVICLSKRWFELVDRVNSGELKITQENGFANAKNNFSYPACAEHTLHIGYGQLNYKMGHAGIGVVASSGYGDGCYPCYATIVKKTGRVKELRIRFY